MSHALKPSSIPILTKQGSTFSSLPPLGLHHGRFECLFTDIVFNTNMLFAGQSTSGSNRSNRFPPSLGSVITRNSRVSGDPSGIDVAIMEHHYAGKRCILTRRRLVARWCQIIPRNGRGHETLASTQLES